MTFTEFVRGWAVVPGPALLALGMLFAAGCLCFREGSK